MNQFNFDIIMLCINLIDRVWFFMEDLGLLFCSILVIKQITAQLY